MSEAPQLANVNQGGTRTIAGGWPRADIIAELAKRESRITHLARRVGLDRNHLNASLDKPRDTPGHRIIAAALGLSLHALFPDWYGPDNKLIRPKDEKRAS